MHLRCGNNSLNNQLARRKGTTMKRFILLAIGLLMAHISPLKSQPQEDFSWSFQYEGYGAHDELFAVTEDDDFNSIVTGKVMHENGECDVFIGSFYGLPYPNWIYRYTGNSTSAQGNAILYKSNYVYVTGTARTTNDLMVFKLDAAAGTIVTGWPEYYSYGSGYTDVGKFINLGINDTVFVCGSSSNGTTALTVLLKYTPAGVRKIVVQYAYSSTPYGMVLDPTNNDVYVLMYADHGLGNKGWWLAKYNRFLTFVGEYNVLVNGTPTGGLKRGGDGYLYASGINPSGQPTVLKLNTNLAIQWSRTVSVTSTPTDMCVDNSQVHVAGSYAISYDLNGNLAYSIAQPSGSSGQKITADPSNNGIAYICYNQQGRGYLTSYDAAGILRDGYPVTSEDYAGTFNGMYGPVDVYEEVWLVGKAYGTESIYEDYFDDGSDYNYDLFCNAWYSTGASAASKAAMNAKLAMKPKPETRTPSENKLRQNYPNPFNPVTNIQFSLKEDGIATIKVFNSIGQVVATLADKQQFSKGEHTVQFDASNLSSGVYFYRISVDGENAYEHMKKMTVIK